MERFTQPAQLCIVLKTHRTRCNSLNIAREMDIFPAKVAAAYYNVFFAVYLPGRGNTASTEVCLTERLPSPTEIAQEIIVIFGSGEFDRLRNSAFICHACDQCFCAADIDADIHRFPPFICLQCSMVYTVRTWIDMTLELPRSAVRNLGGSYRR